MSSSGKINGISGVYMPDAVPASPNANDDEFNDSSIGGAWAEWDFGNIGTIAEDTYGLLITNANTSGDKFCGIYRSTPSSDWSITAKVHPVNINPSVIRLGIAVFQDATDINGDFRFWGISEGGNYNSENWNAYNSFGNDALPNLLRSICPLSYLRLRRISTTYLYDVSNDGKQWWQLTSGTLTYTPLHIGFAMYNQNATAQILRVSFWRQTATTTLNQTLLGRIL